MIHDVVLGWRGDIVLSRDLAVAGERSEFFNRVRSGEFVPILRGAYLRSEVWAAADSDARHLHRIAAAVALAPGSVFSHESAAALWSLPSVAGWPSRVHVLHSGDRTRTSTTVFVRHASATPAEQVKLGGAHVTGLARTVVDVAATRPFAFAVAMADAALRRTDHPVRGLPRTFVLTEDLLREARSLPTRHGSARANRAILFSNGAADGPGESVSRCSMSIARISPPELQVVLFGASGARYVVDFWWPRFNHIGEFDGFAKYTDPRFLRGRTPEQALRDEKYREDDLRQAGHGMARWSWGVANDPAALKTHLLRSGVT